MNTTQTTLPFDKSEIVNGECLALIERLYNICEREGIPLLVAVTQSVAEEGDKFKVAVRTSICSRPFTNEKGEESHYLPPALAHAANCLTKDYIALPQKTAMLSALAASLLGPDTGECTCGECASDESSEDSKEEAKEENKEEGQKENGEEILGKRWEPQV